MVGTVLTTQIGTNRVRTVEHDAFSILFSEPPPLGRHNETPTVCTGDHLVVKITAGVLSLRVWWRLPAGSARNRKARSTFSRQVVSLAPPWYDHVSRPMVASSPSAHSWPILTRWGDDAGVLADLAGGAVAHIAKLNQDFAPSQSRPAGDSSRQIGLMHSLK